MFHTSLALHADWGTSRCGDARAAAQLLRAATPSCHEVLGTLSHPVSPTDGGGGLRRDLPRVSATPVHYTYFRRDLSRVSVLF